MFDHDRTNSLHSASDEDLERELLFRQELKGAVLVTKGCESYEKVPKFKEVVVRYPSSGLVSYYHGDTLEFERMKFDVYKEGQEAAMEDQSDAQNPYSEKGYPNQHAAWLEGWNSVQTLMAKVRDHSGGGHSGR